MISKRVLVLTMRNNVRITVARRKGAEVASVLAQRTGIVIGEGYTTYNIHLNLVVTTSHLSVLLLITDAVSTESIDPKPLLVE